MMLRLLSGKPVEGVARDGGVGENVVQPIAVESSSLIMCHDDRHGDGKKLQRCMQAH